MFRFEETVHKKDDSGPDDDPVDREKEKDGFDGTEESLDTRFVSESTLEESRPSSPNSRDLSNRPETYRIMGVNGPLSGTCLISPRFPVVSLIARW